MTIRPKLTSNSLVALLNTTRDDATKWTEAAFKTSNDQLLTQLRNCLDIFHQLRAADAGVRKSFNHLYVGAGFPSNGATPLATKIVRYVFQTDRRRCATYSRVLRTATERGIEPSGLAKWVGVQGGLEEIRRTPKGGVAPSVIEKRQVAHAEATLSKCKSLVQIVDAPNALLPKNDAVHNFSIAILRRDRTGTSSIVYGLDDERLIKMALSRAGKKLGASQAAVASAQAASAQRKLRTALIKKTITKLAA